MSYKLSWNDGPVLVSNAFMIIKRFDNIGSEIKN